ncbi:MAG: hypothetical protein SGARI_006477 [Bacillariaceae sp.]
MVNDAVMSAQEIYDLNTQHMLQEGRTVYVATDEKSIEYFGPLRVHYQMLFLWDFKEELGNINPNYLGMVDQLVAAKGKTFVGTYPSTFSAYINRLRGYHSQMDQSPVGYERGRVDSYYFTPNRNKVIRDIMQTYHGVDQNPEHSLEKGFWCREFPVAWTDIDHDV